MASQDEVREALLSGEQIIQVNVPYEQDGEEHEFEAEIPESFADDMGVILDRAERRLPEEAELVGSPYRVGPIPDYDPV